MVWSESPAIARITHNEDPYVFENWYESPDDQPVVSDPNQHE